MRQIGSPNCDATTVLTCNIFGINDQHFEAPMAWHAGQFLRHSGIRRRHGKKIPSTCVYSRYASFKAPVLSGLWRMVRGAGHRHFHPMDTASLHHHGGLQLTQASVDVRRGEVVEGTTRNHDFWIVEENWVPRSIRARRRSDQPSGPRNRIAITRLESARVSSETFTQPCGSAPSETDTPHSAAASLRRSRPHPGDGSAPVRDRHRGCP